MHEAGFTHCDIKPDNVCFNSVSRRTVCLIDFGSSLSTGDTKSSYVQARWYRAPEVMLGIPWNSQIDMWSLGCLICELRLGQPVFRGSSVAEVLAAQQAVLGMHPLSLMNATDADLRRVYFGGDRLYAIDRTGQPPGRYELRPQPVRLTSLLGTEDEGFLDFVSRLLEYTPSLRMSAVEALEHPWMESRSGGLPGMEVA